jgi:thymidylate kinase
VSVPLTDVSPVEARQPRARPNTPISAPLQVLQDLFNRLHAEDIRYCHWKSNEHLAASMSGVTDVDVLVERRAAQRLTRLLTDTTSFKRFVVKAGRGYPGIEDYVGFDSSTGKLTHLHIHYQLTLGEKFLKGHRLPWEAAMLATRVMHEEHETYVTDPHLELLILVSRAALKLRLRDFPLAMVGRRYFGGSMLRELRWLAARVRPDRLVAVATPLVGGRAADLLLPMVTGPGPTIGQLRAFRHSVDPSLSSYRMYTAAGATRRMWLREWTWIWWRIKNWLLRAPTKSTRTPPQGGLAIAFVGPDGAGKSTLTNGIAEWLSPAIAVVSTYGGSGKGTASRPRRSLQLVASLVRRKALPGNRAPAASQTKDVSGPRLLGRLLWVLTLARERRRWALQMRRARSLGLVVLSDRLPQTQFVGLNDGPRLGHWLESRSWLRRVAAQREQASFLLAELVPPDVVVRLHVPVNVAAGRKPDTPLDQLRRKVDIVAKLEFPAATRIVEINAAQTLERVLLDVKQAVWECL